MKNRWKTWLRDYPESQQTIPMANEKVPDTVNYLGNANDKHSEIPAERLKKPKLTQSCLVRTQNTLGEWKSVQPLWKAVRQRLLKVNLWPSNVIPRRTAPCSRRDEQGWDMHSSTTRNNPKQETTQKSTDKSPVTQKTIQQRERQSLTVRNNVNDSCTCYRAEAARHIQSIPYDLLSFYKALIEANRWGDQNGG